MNLDEYREMKAQETEEVVVDAQIEQGAVANVEQVVQTPTEIEQPQSSGATETPVQEDAPQVPTKVTYNGQEFEVEQLVQAQTEAERLRQENIQASRTVQQASVAQQYYTKLMENPEYAKAFAEKNGLMYLDPKEQAIQELEQNYNNLLVKQEIDTMKIKYPDFNEQEVLKFAVDRRLSSLDDAYTLFKAQSGTASPAMDIEAIKAQIRQELQAELQSNTNTGSMIGSSGGGAKSVQSQTTDLSSAELRIAQGLGISAKEYQKWKDA